MVDTEGSDSCRDEASSYSGEDNAQAKARRYSSHFVGANRASASAGWSAGWSREERLALVGTTVVVVSSRLGVFLTQYSLAESSARLCIRCVECYL